MVEEKSGSDSQMWPGKNTGHSLSSNDIAIWGLKEIALYHWFDIESLGLVSMLSVRARQTVIDGRYWRVAVRAMFPQHPFEVLLLISDVFHR